jgi:hypothetical protein
VASLTLDPIFKNGAGPVAALSSSVGQDFMAEPAQQQPA